MRPSPLWLRRGNPVAGHPRVGRSNARIAHVRPQHRFSAAPWLFKLLEPLAERVLRAHPNKLGIIAESTRVSPIPRRRRLRASHGQGPPRTSSNDAPAEAVLVGGTRWSRNAASKSTPRPPALCALTLETLSGYETNPRLLFFIAFSWTKMQRILQRPGPLSGRVTCHDMSLDIKFRSRGYTGGRFVRRIVA